MNQYNKWVVMPVIAALSIGIAACNSKFNSADNNLSDPADIQNEKTVGYFQHVESDKQLEQYITRGVRATGTINDYNSLPKPLPSEGNDNSYAALSGDGPAYSSTYLQEAGVDESDIVKYDGRHLFVIEQPEQLYGWISMAEPEIFPELVDPIFTISTADNVLSQSAIMLPVGGEPGDVVDNYASIRILSTQQQPASAKEIAKITLDEANLGIDGLYILPAADNTLAGDSAAKDLLAVVGVGQINYGWDYWRYNGAWSNGRTGILLYDITSPENSSELWKMEIEGHLITSRRVDNVLYVVTRHYPELNGLYGSSAVQNLVAGDAVDTGTATNVSIADLIPTKVVDDGPITPLVNATDCLIPSSTQGVLNYSGLVTITAIDLRQPQSYRSLCFDAPTEGYYASMNAIYFTTTNWENGGTDIHKFSFKDGNPEYAGSGIVPGNIGWNNPAFRMAERAGVLHIVTSPSNWLETLGSGIGIDDGATSESNESIAIGEPNPDGSDQSSDPGQSDPEPATDMEQLTGHRLTLLKESDTAFELTEVSHIPSADSPAPLGKPGEDIFAVRYTGARAYVVTFRQTDPLYVIDISNSAAPRIAGELQVSGFSSLLHPISDTLLLGFGHDADEAGIQKGYKIELFYVADIAAPVSLSSVIIGTAGTSSPVDYNHHALTFLNGGVDTNSRFAIPVERYEADYTWVDSGLHLFEIEGTDNPSTALITGKGSLLIEQRSDEKMWPQYYGEQRSVIHGDAVHYIAGDKVWSASWNDTTTLVGPQ